MWPHEKVQPSCGGFQYTSFTHFQGLTQRKHCNSLQHLGQLMKGVCWGPVFKALELNKIHLKCAKHGRNFEVMFLLGLEAFVTSVCMWESWGLGAALVSRKWSSEQVKPGLQLREVCRTGFSGSNKSNHSHIALHEVPRTCSPNGSFILSWSFCCWSHGQSPRNPQ